MPLLNSRPELSLSWVTFSWVYSVPRKDQRYKLRYKLFLPNLFQFINCLPVPPALANAGPDCDSCGGPLKVTVHRHVHIQHIFCLNQSFVLYSHHKIIREFCVVSHCVFLKITNAQIPPLAGGSIAPNLVNRSKAGPGPTIWQWPPICEYNTYWKILRAFAKFRKARNNTATTYGLSRHFIFKYKV